MPPRGAGFRRTGLADDEAKHCRSGAGSAFWFQSSKLSIDAERDITAGLIFQIVSGKAAGERDLHGTKIDARETAASARIILLVAERAAFECETRS